MSARDHAAGDAVRHENRPAQATLRYRLATQPEFLARMLAQLAGQTIPDGGNAGARPLAALSTRERRDPTIALLDAFACVADVITLYQEYIANEGFLGTATEERSVRHLARTLGYEPGPGVNASTWLAFEVSQPPGLLGEFVEIPAGTKVQSIPVRGERPQTFETDEPLDAHQAWNQLRLMPAQPETQASRPESR